MLSSVHGSGDDHISKDSIRQKPSPARFALRVAVFMCGLTCIAFGVAVTSRASLGVTPIAAIPFSLSAVFPSLSFGMWVIAFNLALIAGEVLLLRGRARLPTIITQAFLTCVFGTCVDISLLALGGLAPHGYAQCVAWVVCGSLILGTGVFLTIRSNVAVLPGDGITMAAAAVFARDFGRIRMLSDILMAVTGLAICWLALDDLVGVREGTVIASLITSPFVRLLLRLGRPQKAPGENGKK